MSIKLGDIYIEINSGNKYELIGHYPSGFQLKNIDNALVHDVTNERFKSDYVIYRDNIPITQLPSLGAVYKYVDGDCWFIKAINFPQNEITLVASFPNKNLPNTKLVHPIDSFYSFFTLVMGRPLSATSGSALVNMQAKQGLTNILNYHDRMLVKHNQTGEEYMLLQFGSGWALQNTKRNGNDIFGVASATLDSNYSIITSQQPQQGGIWGGWAIPAIPAGIQQQSNSSKATDSKSDLWKREYSRDNRTNPKPQIHNCPHEWVEMALFTSVETRCKHCDKLQPKGN